MPIYRVHQPQLIVELLAFTSNGFCRAPHIPSYMNYTTQHNTRHPAPHDVYDQQTMDWNVSLRENDKLSLMISDIGDISAIFDDIGDTSIILGDIGDTSAILCTVGDIALVTHQPS